MTEKGSEKYPICKVGDVANAVDPQPSHRTPPVSDDGIPYVSIADCDYKTRSVNFEGARKVSRKVLEEHRERYTLHEGDFVIGKIGTIGNPIFVPAEQNYTLSANIVLIQPDSEKILPYFLLKMFESEYVERQMEMQRHATSQSAFGIKKARELNIVLPPIERQREFVDFVEQSDKSKFVYQEASNWEHLRRIFSSK